jgi:hypothetical protein
VRNALVYVLNNWKKHVFAARGLDPRSSAAWFDGWLDRTRSALGPAPIADPRTWLARVGWRRRGGIRVDEVPSARAKGRSRRR